MCVPSFPIAFKVLSRSPTYSFHVNYGAGSSTAYDTQAFHSFNEIGDRSELAWFAFPPQYAVYREAMIVLAARWAFNARTCVLEHIRCVL